MFGQGDEWKFRKEVNGIKAYTQKHDWTKFDEYRVETILETNISNILAVFKDFDVYPSVFKGCTQVITHLDEPDRYINYILSNAPFPAKDRDGVYQNVMTYDANKKRLHIDVSCINDYYEKSNKFIQIENCKGFWDITQIAPGQVEVIHQFVLDPGGIVPAWIINMQTVKAPLHALTSIKELVNLPKYQNKKFAILNNQK
jgi:hypothetical protein